MKLYPNHNAPSCNALKHRFRSVLCLLIGLSFCACVAKIKRVHKNIKVPLHERFKRQALKCCKHAQYIMFLYVRALIFYHTHKM